MNNTEMAKELTKIAFEIMDDNIDSHNAPRILLNCILEIYRKEENSPVKDLNIQVDLQDFIEELKNNHICDETFRKELDKTWDKLITKINPKLFFKVQLNTKMNETPIEALNLSVRAYNNLKRAGYKTIGELADAIASGIDIRKINKCGTRSYEEIMEKLFSYQYNVLPQEKRADYIDQKV